MHFSKETLETGANFDPDMSRVEQAPDPQNSNQIECNGGCNEAEEEEAAAVKPAPANGPAEEGAATGARKKKSRLMVPRESMAVFPLVDIEPIRSIDAACARLEAAVHVPVETELLTPEGLHWLNKFCPPHGYMKGGKFINAFDPEQMVLRAQRAGLHAIYCVVHPRGFDVDRLPLLLAVAHLQPRKDPGTH